MSETINLTEFSHGGGCGCKISPKVLEEILHSTTPAFSDDKLLVGNSSKDDAAVYNLGNGTALISTTDFFMPIVNDAVAFGRIAACNAISDVYAMGGKPMLAIAVLGWPVQKIPASEAQKVMNGAREACTEAGIALAGGHSIDSPEPFFGLAVNGLVDIKNLKQNNTAKAGDYIFITKPIGTGIMATSQKRKLISDEHLQILIKQLGTLNKIGEQLSCISGVNAMTDVTGFGLLGHLIEMAEGSGLSAELNYSKIKFMEPVRQYLSLKAVPDATTRNWSSYGHKVGFEQGVNVMEAFNLLPDPQTNGGIMCAVSPESLGAVQELFRNNGLEDFIEPIGVFKQSGEKVVNVLP